MLRNLLFILLFPVVLLAQESTVFTSGQEGYASYRIPAIVQMINGDLLAIAEGRVNDMDDFGNIDIVAKISKDQGKTWGKLHILADYQKLQAGNPAPVVDLFGNKGRVYVFYNTGNNHESEVRNGRGLREAWYIYSDDNGNSWSEPANITTQVHRPKQPQINPAYNFEQDWRTYANTPGHAFQMVSGPYKGRILIAANHNSGDQKPGNVDWNAHAYYTDDFGKTFKLSSKIPYPGSNESTAAQLSDTEVFMSSRNQRMQPRVRIVSISKDGGQTWDSSFEDSQLIDPINQGAVLSWKKGKKFILAHCNADHAQERDNLTLKLSADKGNTWFKKIVVAKSPEGYTGAYAAYSDIVKVGKKTIGILYEKEHYAKIVYTTVQF